MVSRNTLSRYGRHKWSLVESIWPRRSLENYSTKHKARLTFRSFIFNCLCNVKIFGNLCTFTLYTWQKPQYTHVLILNFNFGMTTSLACSVCPQFDIVFVIVFTCVECWSKSCLNQLKQKACSAVPARAVLWSSLCIYQWSPYKVLHALYRSHNWEKIKLSKALVWIRKSSSSHNIKENWRGRRKPHVFICECSL